MKYPDLLQTAEYRLSRKGTNRMAEGKKSVYETLSAIDVSKYLKTKGEGRYALKYLSWAHAWKLLKKYYPDTLSPVNIEFPEYLKDPQTRHWYATGRDVDYRLTNAGCEVQAKIIIAGNTYKCSLYVMDNRNHVVHNPDLAMINKTQMRCWVKCLALAGLGIDVYAGEDLTIWDTPDDRQERKPATRQLQNRQRPRSQNRPKAYKQTAKEPPLSKEQEQYHNELVKEGNNCWNLILDHMSEFGFSTNDEASKTIQKRAYEEKPDYADLKNIEQLKARVEAMQDMLSEKGITETTGLKLKEVQ